MTVFILYNPHVMYIFSALSLCLDNLYNSFSPSFVSNTTFKSSYAPPFAIATACFALLFFCTSFYYFHLLFNPMLSLPYSFFMLYCISSFHHHVFLSPLGFSNFTPNRISAIFLRISAVLTPHQVAHSRLPKS